MLQADAYAGYNQFYASGRAPGGILEAACWAHARRPFFALADIEASARRKAEGKAPAPISPLALEAVRRIDALFEIERTINGQSAEERRAVRQQLSAPLVAKFKAWMRVERPKLSRGSDVANAMDYMLKRWTPFTPFLDDGRIEIGTNTVERSIRPIALGRKSWLFAGSDRGRQRRRHVQPDRHGQGLRRRALRLILRTFLPSCRRRPASPTSRRCCRGTSSGQPRIASPPNPTPWQVTC